MEISNFEFVPQIPTEYAVEKIPLTWSDIYWACKHRMFDALKLIEFAKSKGPTNKLESELAGLDGHQAWRVDEIVKELVKGELRTSEERTISKWLYIVLSYLYEHKNDFENPLARIEEIYADFGHPQEMRPFIRYEPVDIKIYNPTLHSKEENIERLYSLWANYLRDKESALTKKDEDQVTHNFQ